MLLDESVPQYASNVQGRDCSGLIGYQVSQKQDLGAIIRCKPITGKPELVCAEGYEDGFVVDLAAC